MAAGGYRVVPTPAPSPFQTGIAGRSGAIGMLETSKAIIAARELSMMAGGSPVRVRQAATKASLGMAASVSLEGMG
ncbi:hypothetical protein MKK63_29685 [Methylobacterium sp. J-088]|uniref:hypothetical protein n=1 Tax=Methylobacterium sp. J-088 TaxID=2836664 RepID=UPI001FB95780|nr:hypothetical protein [Methylobacterium sp. J-088]MCJ2066829.1 hypothetical protein [Methylobacterium sp. J-088]